MISFGDFREATYSQRMGLDSAAIQRFLGRSVIRKPVYHGTNSPRFDQFEKRQTQRFVLFSAFDVHAQGFFFSESKKDARSFGKRLITAYVRLEKPFVDPRRDKNLGVDALDPMRQAQLAYMLRTMFDEHPHYGRGFDLMLKRVGVGDRFARDKDYDWVHEVVRDGGLLWDVLDHPGVTATLRRLGYDGTFVHEPESYSGRSIFVVDPEQVMIVSQG